jgi:hypothetical protein
MDNNAKDKPWLAGLLEINNEVKKDDKDSASIGNSNYWANLVIT